MRSLEKKRIPVMLWGLATTLLLSGCAGSGDEAPHQALAQVLPTEDARPTAEAERGPLLEALRSGDAQVRRFAVRGLGRLEDPELVPAAAGLLSDPDPEVRATAAFAVAQAVHGSDGAAALEPLLAAARSESLPAVRNVLARSLGRIRPAGAAPPGVLPVISAWIQDPDLPPKTAVGAALGLESLSRASGPAGSDPALYEALRSLAAYAPSGAADLEAVSRTRAVALLALGQRGQLDPVTLEAGLRDEDPVVRATAARYLRLIADAEVGERIMEALQDSALIVRIEALRAVAVAERTDPSCRMLLDRARNDDDTGARLVALEALGEPCPESVGDDVTAHLDSVASALSSDLETEWSPATYALGALAHLAPERARAILPTHRGHRNPFVRAAAASAAEVISDRTTLDDLATDPDPNVRNAALPALFALEGRALRPLLVEQLSSDDGQLLITVAGLLAGTDTSATPDARTAEAAITAFERISAARRETARDPRMALLALIRGSGTDSLARRLEPYLEDYDPVVAAEAAAILEAWTGEARRAAPRRLLRLPLPTAEQLAEMERNVVVLHMAGGGEIAIDLLPLLAPTNAYRFYRLAGEGHFDGLTFHRWVPNFVIQGGSPGANEYHGDGPYTRDEIGTTPHWRGTVGLSTRGRDTGDGQIFVNLVHNVRLDYDYTVFGAVSSGMDVVDALLPGAVIQRAEIRPKD
ncbi:MAG: HEAT repeat domain-containing protein [Gemmatimonadota bacterium]